MPAISGGAMYRSIGRGKFCVNQKRRLENKTATEVFKCGSLADVFTLITRYFMYT